MKKQKKKQNENDIEIHSNTAGGNDLLRYRRYDNMDQKTKNFEWITCFSSSICIPLHLMDVVSQDKIILNNY